MNFKNNIIITLLILAGGLFSSFTIEAQTAKEIHKNMHSKLLANAKSSLDKSVIQDYIKKELEVKEQDSPYGGLSQESIAMIADLLDEARSHTGKRYKYGAKGPDNFDCSGFTGYIYNQFGYNIGTSSRGQFSEGIGVEKSDLRPGDLVFFTGRGSRGGVGHVGIVVTADNEKGSFSFIHAAVSGGIQIDQSSAPYYQKRYLGARRIITE